MVVSIYLTVMTRYCTDDTFNNIVLPMHAKSKENHPFTRLLAFTKRYNDVDMAHEGCFTNLMERGFSGAVCRAPKKMSRMLFLGGLAADE
jgi:hypothetical protein